MKKKKQWHAELDFGVCLGSKPTTIAGDIHKPYPMRCEVPSINKPVISVCFEAFPESVVGSLEIHV